MKKYSNSCLLLLVTFYTLASTELEAQSKFRLRPWVDVPESDQQYTRLRMDTDGRLLGLLPNYVFNGQGSTCSNSTLGQGIAISLQGLGKESKDFKAYVTAMIDSLDKQKAAVAELCKAAGAGPCDWLKTATIQSADWDGNSNGLWPLELQTVLSIAGGKSPTYHLVYWKGMALSNEGGAVDQPVKLSDSTLTIPFNGSLSGYSGPLRFQLNRSDERTQLLKAWLTKLDLKHRPELTDLISEYTALPQKMDSISADWARLVDPVKCDSVFNTREQVLKDLQKLNNRSTALIAQWKLGWLWYTGNPDVVDPFKLQYPDSTGLADDKRKRDVLSGILKECKANCSLAYVDEILAELKTVEDRIESHQQKVVSYKKTIQHRVHPKTRVSGDTLSSHLIYVSSREDAHFMVHFDGRRKFAKMNATERTTYYDFEKQHFLVHHYIGDSSALKVAIVLTPEAPTTLLAQELEGPLTALAGLSGTDPSSTIKELFTYTAPTSQFTGFKSSSFAPSKRNQAKAAYRESLDTCSLRLAELQKNVDQELLRAKEHYVTLQLILSVMDVKQRTSPASAPQYTTVVQPNTPLEGNNKIAYTLKHTTGTGDAAKVADVGMGSFKLYKPQHVQVFGGLALTLVDVSRIGISATGGTADVTRADERLGFLIGLKWHAFKGGTDLSDNNLVFTCRRIAFVGGLGLPNPLDDLYLGVSYDLVPGISVAIMNHWYRNETAVFLNGAITETKSYYPLAFTPAVSLNFDSSLFGNTLKVFSK